MSSGTPPQRGPAPPEHDEMSHDRNGKNMGKMSKQQEEKFREALDECNNKLEMQAQPQQNCAPINTQAALSTSLQIQTANQGLDDICLQVRYARSKLHNVKTHNAVESPAFNSQAFAWIVQASDMVNDIKQLCVDLGRRYLCTRSNPFAPLVCEERHDIR